MFTDGEQRGVRRAHSPDTYEDTQNNFRGPGLQAQFRGQPRGFGGNYPFNKRHRGENFQSAPLTIEERIVRLGETGSKTADIGDIAKAIEIDLMNKGQDEEKIKALTTKICQCIVSFPTRIGAYSTLIGLISVKYYNAGCQIISTLHASYPVYLEAQRWDEALTIIHLISSLVNCKLIRPSALISQFELLLECTQEDTIPQARSDYYAYTVLSSLPHVALALSEQSTVEAFNKLLETVEAYLNKRSKAHLNIIRVWSSDDSTVQMDYLDSLWVQMKNFRANGWNETFLHRPYYCKDYGDILASNLIPTNSPTLQIPGHKDDYVYPAPRIVFRLFEDDVTEGNRSIPGSDKIERFCIENHIRNIIDEIPGNTRDCARHLTNMYRNEHLTMKHILIETILGELFLIPKPKHPEILYHMLLFEFTKIFTISKNPEELKYNYDVVLNGAVKILYENLDTMSVTCFTRFTEWFSFHLNHIEFIFPWQFWKDPTLKEPTSAKRLFVQNILDRCIRFSFHKKIGALIQDTLSDLMPPEVRVTYNPVFCDNPKAGELMTTIKKLIVEKADGKTISETLNIQIDGVELPDDFMLKDEEHVDSLLKIDIFTAVILEMASKTLTHLSSAIGKFRNVLKALTRVPHGQIQLLQTIHSCLEAHPQLEVILIDKLLKAELIEAPQICQWIFSESMKAHHFKSLPWELLGNTIKRSVQNINKLVAERDAPKEEETVKDEKPPRRSTPTADGDDSSDVEGEKDAEMKPDDEEKKEAARKEREALDIKIESARSAHAELILQVFRLFAQVLDDHIKECKKANQSFMDDYYRWVTGRMLETYHTHHDSTLKLHSQISTIVDRTPSIGSAIVNLNQ